MGPLTSSDVYILLYLCLSPARTAASTTLPPLPIVVNTWSGPFTSATESAFSVLAANGTALSAVQAGCSTCERLACDSTVGPRGSPDEACETTLDALIMDGDTMAAGAVAGLRRIPTAIAVARAVMDYTSHTLLVGDAATAFAVQHGFVEEDISPVPADCAAWRARSCQPNFRRNVLPDPRASCGPYTPELPPCPPRHSPVLREGHDTIAQLALDSAGSMAAGTSTNGAAHAVPGRVGDAPIVGAGAYVDSDVGACGATGDGDVLMRFGVCWAAVEALGRGIAPGEAAEAALARVVARYPAVRAGLVVLDRHGRHGGAGVGWDFSYSFRAAGMARAEVVHVEPMTAVRQQDGAGLRLQT